MLLHPDLLWKEITLTFRGLRKERAFTALSVVLLALGIGFASAVFTLLWQAIYAQLPVPEPEQIFTFKTNVTHNGRSQSDAMAQTFSAPAYRYLAGHLASGMEITARHGELVNVETASGPRHLLADFAAANFFDVLRARPVIGRAFDANDRFAAVLSYDFWQEAYGGQASAWNSTLRVNGLTFTVVGVAPPGFHGLVAGQAPKLYLPLAVYNDLNPGWRGDGDWALRWLNAFVRLSPHLSRQAAEAQFQPVYRAAVRQELASEGTQPPQYLRELSHEYVSLVPASQGVHGMLDRWKEPLRILQWMTLAVLLLAAINIAGLMVARAVKQRHEVLIRYAVGATRMAVMRLRFLEALAVSVAGGLLGLLVARWSIRLLLYLARMDQAQSFTMHGPQGWLLWAHWTAAILVGLLVGFFPAWHAARINVAEGLNEGALTHSGSRSQALTRRLLASAQIALSLVLVIAAGLFAQALHQLVSVPVGFNPEHLTVFSIDAKLAHANVQNTEMLWAAIAHRFETAPDVQAVTYGMGGPFPQDADAAVVFPGNTTAKHHQTGIRSIVGPRYFATLGIPIVAGREFDSRDRANTPDVVILNQTLARKLFGTENPVGRTVTVFNGLDPTWIASVAGIAADHYQSWRRANAALLYTPAQQARRVTDMTYYVRTRHGTLSEQTIRQLVRGEAPAIAPYDIATMQTRMAGFASGERAITLLVGVFAALALVIAALGIYGVVSYSASLRTAEFAIRISVGARPADIIRLVLREAALILGAGILLALPLTYLSLSIIRGQLEGMAVEQPAIYAGAVLLLTACALLAAGLPARRATRLSVHAALRQS